MSELVVMVLKGAVSGAIYGAWGYHRLGEEGEKFRPAKFIRAVASGIISGGVAGYSGLSYPAADAEVHGILADVGLLIPFSLALDQAASWIWSKVSGKEKK